MSLMAQGVGHVGAIIQADADAKIAVVNARLDYLESQVAVSQRYKELVSSPLWQPAIEAMSTGEESEWQMAQDLGCTVPELRFAVERWKRSWRR